MSPTDNSSVQKFSIDVAGQKDKLAGYLNAKMVVHGYVQAVLNTDISGVSFKDLPDNLKKDLPEDPAKILAALNKNLTSAKGHANTWNNTIEPGLTQVPQSIINFNDRFNTTITDITPYLNTLIDCGNGTEKDKNKCKQAREFAVSAFNGILGLIGEQKKAVQTEIDSLQTFNTNIHTDAENFSSKNKDFVLLEQFDQTNIDSLNTAITQIESAISTLDKAITAEAVAAGVSVAVAGAGIAMIASGGVVKPIIGAILVVVGMIGIGVSLAELVSSIQQKAEEESKETTDKLEVSLLTQQLTSVKSVEKSLGNLVTLSSQAAGATQVILDTFTTLEKKVTAVITDLQDAKKDLGTFMSIPDLQTAVTQWGELKTFASQMQDLNQSVQVKPGSKNAVNVPVKGVTKTAA